MQQQKQSSAQGSSVGGHGSVGAGSASGSTRMQQTNQRKVHHEGLGQPNAAGKMAGDSRHMGGTYPGQGMPNGRAPFQKQNESLGEAQKPNSRFGEQQKLSYLQKQQNQHNHMAGNASHEGIQSSQTYMTQQANQAASRRGPPQHQTMYMTSAQAKANEHPINSRQQHTSYPPMPQPSSRQMLPGASQPTPRSGEQYRGGRYPPPQLGPNGMQPSPARHGRQPPPNERTSTSTALSGTHEQTGQMRNSNPTQASQVIPYQGQAPVQQNNHTSQSIYGGAQPPYQPQQLAPNRMVQPSGAILQKSTLPATDTMPKLQNIVSTAKLNAELDLYKIGLEGRNVEYKPKRFAAAIMRIREPKTTALIFRSGKMVCTGAKSESDSHTAAKSYARQLKKIGNPSVRLTDFIIQNIVGSHDVGFQIKLEALHHHSKEKRISCRYDPELFPGLIFRMVDPKVVLLIFASGKIVLTGAKQRQQIYDAYEKIYSLLHLHKNNHAV